MTEPAEEFRVLCVDDEPRVLDGMRRTLGMNFDVQTAEGGAQALAPPTSLPGAVPRARGQSLELFVGWRSTSKPVSRIPVQ